jgi:DNA polymerase-3 subunit delta'
VTDPFDGVLGQESAVRALRAILARGGGAGSTLLLGPEGVGRFLLAVRAARAILGGGAAGSAQVEAISHPDLTVLEGGKDGIDEVRDALPRLSLRPAAGPRQVLLLRDLDRFDGSVHDALLKTLEEPPGGAAVFAVAEDVAHLPETVVSRCRVVRLRALPEPAVGDFLRARGLPAEGAADAEGSPGRALFHIAAGVAAEAETLLRLLTERARDPVGEAEKLAKSRKDEDAAGRRRRQVEVLRAAAARARRRRPVPEDALRRLLEGLGSIRRNANPSIVFAELALTPWKNTATAS